MKILTITNLYPPHHAGTFDFRCQAVMDNLKQRGHEIKILTSRYSLTKEQRDPEIDRSLILNGAYGQPLLTSFSELRALEETNHQFLQENMDEFQPDLVYVWSLKGISKSLLFSLRQAKVPVVFDVADNWIIEIADDPWIQWWNKPGRPFLSKAARAMFELVGKRRGLDKVTPTRAMAGYDRMLDLYQPADRGIQPEPNSVGTFQFDRIYFSSQALRDRTMAAGFRVSHADVIYPGIQTEVFVGEVKPQSAPVKKFLIESKLDDASGVLTALAALRTLKANNIHFAINICGKGESEYIAKLRSFVIQHELKVEFLSVSNLLKDLAALYKQHDAFIYSKEGEDAFALAPMQAMAAGLPVIAAKSGAIPELIQFGQNGFTYAPGNSDELANRMNDLQLQPALRCTVAEAGQNLVLSQFNNSAVTDQIESFLNASLEGWGAH